MGHSVMLEPISEGHSTSFDARLSPTSTVHSSHQKPLVIYLYEPYGNVISVTESFSDGQPAFPYRYCGAWGVRFEPSLSNAGNSFYYMRQRWYYGYLQRFLSRDQVRKVNRYVYCQNNPVTRIDPSGLEDLGPIGPPSYPTAGSVTPQQAGPMTPNYSNFTATPDPGNPGVNLYSNNSLPQGSPVSIGNVGGAINAGVQAANEVLNTPPPISLGDVGAAIAGGCDAAAAALGGTTDGIDLGNVGEAMEVALDAARAALGGGDCPAPPGPASIRKGKAHYSRVEAAKKFYKNRGSSDDPFHHHGSGDDPFHHPNKWDHSFDPDNIDGNNPRFRQKKDETIYFPGDKRTPDTDRP